MNNATNRPKSKTKREGSDIHKLLESAVKLVSTVIAIVAIFFSTVNKDVTKVQLAEHTSPNLKSLAIMDSTIPENGIKVINSGAGTALVEDVKFYNAKHELLDGRSFSLTKEYKLDQKGLIANILRHGDIIKEGEEHWFIKSTKSSPETSVAINDLLHEMSISICYCSLDNKCHSKTIGLKGAPVTQCS